MPTEIVRVNAHRALGGLLSIYRFPLYMDTFTTKADNMAHSLKSPLVP